MPNEREGERERGGRGNSSPFMLAPLMAWVEILSLFVLRSDEQRSDEAEGVRAVSAHFRFRMADLRLRYADTKSSTNEKWGNFAAL